MSLQKSILLRSFLGFIHDVALLGGAVALFVERTPLLASVFIHYEAWPHPRSKIRALWVDRTAASGWKAPNHRCLRT